MTGGDRTTAAEGLGSESSLGASRPSGEYIFVLATLGGSTPPDFNTPPQPPTTPRGRQALVCFEFGS